MSFTVPEFRRVALGVTLAALPAAAWAHHVMEGRLPSTFVEGLLSGLGHPLIGVDHAAFIVVAGFLLALVEGGLWGVLALIGGALAGAALHLAGFNLPDAESIVALSVLVVGGLLATHRQVRLPWLAAGLALAGLAHGHAYAETIFGAEPAPLGAYLLGFSLIQLAVASAAFFAHRRLLAARTKWAGLVSSGLGTAAVLLGAAFLGMMLGTA